MYGGARARLARRVQVGRRFAVWMFVLAPFGALSGCGAVLVVAQSELITGAGVASYVFTGKSLLDHATGAVTKKDCSLMGGVLSSKRKVCEPYDSVYAHTGFKGLVGVLHKDDKDEATIATAPGTPSLRLSSTIQANSDEPAPRQDQNLAASSPPNLTFSEDLAGTQNLAQLGQPFAPETVSVARTSLSSL